jgi:SAM-dependent methyltransferase
MSSVTPTLHGREPASAWIEKYAYLARKQGTVLDLACGAGRHVRLFAAMGMQVTAVDRNAQALAELTQTGVKTVWADIENGPWPLEGQQFDCVVVTNYLWRPLLSRIADSVNHGGVILYETFAQGNERYGKPSNSEFLLAPDELLVHFGPAKGFHVVAYEDLVIESPKPACVQRICAVKQPG